MNYWLVKSEPEAYSWQTFVKEGRTMWEGVRNYQARNNMQKMQEGDQVLFYHSFDKEVMGKAKVVLEAYPDPTADSDKWVVVDIVPDGEFDRPVTLAEIKATDELSNLPLLKQSRLSVMPLEKDEFETIVKLGSKKR